MEPREDTERTEFMLEEAAERLAEIVVAQWEWERREKVRGHDGVIEHGGRTWRAD